MVALENTSGFVIFLVVSGLLASLVVGFGYLFQKKFGDKEPVMRCPNCNHVGKTYGWGNFRCYACNHNFATDSHGAVISSLAKPFLNYFLRNHLIHLILLVVCLWFFDASKQNWYLAISIWLLGPHTLLLPLYRKRFPKE